jgi:hypothetical protein
MITINGTSYDGNNISINNGNVVIDGKRIISEDKVINIVVNGNIVNFVIDSGNSIEVNGNIESMKTVSGDVRCDSISGNVNTVSGDVVARSIGGSIKTISGDIN